MMSPVVRRNLGKRKLQHFLNNTEDKENGDGIDHA